MMHSEQFDQVAAALAKAQGDFPTIPRDKLVRVNMKGGGSYTFRYAPLETILEKVRKPLADAGLALVQSIESDQVEGVGTVESVRTTMLHTSGQWFACDVPVFHGAGENRSQAYASGVTYSRRYGVTLLLCVAADEDDDGNGGDQDGQRPDYVRDQGHGRHDDQARRPAPSRTPQRKGQGQRQDHGRGEPQGGPAGGRGDIPVDYGDDALDQRTPEDRLNDALANTDGTPPSVYGDDLTPGQLQMLKARAEGAKLNEAGVRELVGGRITSKNVSGALTLLKEAMQGAMK